MVVCSFLLWKHHVYRIHLEITAFLIFGKLKCLEASLEDIICEDLHGSAVVMPWLGVVQPCSRLLCRAWKNIPDHLAVSEDIKPSVYLNTKVGGPQIL
jgi:hypothetical protein